MTMMKNNIYILDISLMSSKLDFSVNNICNNYGISTNDFRIKYRLKKILMTKAIVKLINDTTDCPAYSLLDMESINEHLDSSDMNQYVEPVYNMVYSMFNSFFRFNVNVAVHIETVVSGNNLMVHAYTENLG